MYNHFKLSQKFLYYYLTASNAKGHGVHSPFVFEFIKTILVDEYQNIYVANEEPIIKNKKTKLRKKTILVTSNYLQEIKEQ